MNTSREAGQSQALVRFAECFLCWIPAFAGMTVLIDYLGLSHLARKAIDTPLFIERMMQIAY
ncbi:MAG: hypothetical protein PHQ60_06600 [Sideroxydans sp.]|nr:hypothetical protein [Sideroxydans sp.]